MSEPSLISILYSKRTKKEQSVINNFLLKNKIQFKPTHNVQKEYQAHVKITNLDQRPSSTGLPLPKSKSPARNENNPAIKPPHSSKRSSPLKPNKNIENNSNLSSNANSSKNLLDRRKSSVDSNAKTRQPSQDTARLEKKNIDSQTMTKLLALVSMNNARVNNLQQGPETLRTIPIETEKTPSKESSPKKKEENSLIRQAKKIPSKKSSPKKKEEESLIKQSETSIDEENIYPKKSISPILDDLLWKIDLRLQSEASSPPNDSKLLASEVQNDYELPVQQEIVSLINLHSVEVDEESNEVIINKDKNIVVENMEVSRPAEPQDDLLYKIQQSLRMVSFERVEEDEEDDDTLPHFGAQRTTTKSFLTTRRETDENILINDQFQLENDFLYKNNKNSPSRLSHNNPEEQKNTSNSPSKMSMATNLELFDSLDVEEFQRLQSQFDEKVSEIENNSPRKQLSTQEELGLHQVPSRESLPPQNFLRSSSINTITRVTETLQTHENEELFNCYAYLLAQTQKPQKDYIPIMEEPSTQKPLKKKENLMKSKTVFNNQNQRKTNEKARPKTPKRENNIPQSNHSRRSSTQYPFQLQKSPSNLSKKVESGISTARSRSNLKPNQANLKGTETNRSSVRSPTPPRSSRINTERKSRSPLDPALMNQNVNYDLMSSKNIVQHYQQLLKKLNNFPLHNSKR